MRFLGTTLIIATFYFQGSCTAGRNHDAAAVTPSDTVPAAAKTPERNTTPPSIAIVGKRKYLGCWAGSRGGRIMISTESIRDLGSKETSSYREVLSKEKLDDSKNLEEYVLVADNAFERSFLDKVIQIKFKRDDLIFVIAYSSYDDYLTERSTGEGTFEKVECDRISNPVAK